VLNQANSSGSPRGWKTRQPSSAPPALDEEITRRRRGPNGCNHSPLCHSPQPALNKPATQPVSTARSQARSCLHLVRRLAAGPVQGSGAGSSPDLSSGNRQWRLKRPRCSPCTAGLAIDIDHAHFEAGRRPLTPGQRRLPGDWTAAIFAVGCGCGRRSTRPAGGSGEKGVVEAGAIYVPSHDLTGPRALGKRALARCGPGQRSIQGGPGAAVVNKPMSTPPAVEIKARDFRSCDAIGQGALTRSRPRRGIVAKPQ